MYKDVGHVSSSEGSGFLAGWCQVIPTFIFLPPAPFRFLLLGLKSHWGKDKSKKIKTQQKHSTFLDKPMFFFWAIPWFVVNPWFFPW